VVNLSLLANGQERHEEKFLYFFEKLPFSYIRTALYCKTFLMKIYLHFLSSSFLPLVLESEELLRRRDDELKVWIGSEERSVDHGKLQTLLAQLDKGKEFSSPCPSGAWDRFHKALVLAENFRMKFHPQTVDKFQRKSNIHI
jgi:hypothetical protein